MKKVVKVIALLGPIFLAGCQAEDIEIEMNASDLLAAFSGTDQSLEFEATVGEKYTKVDDEKRTTIKQISQGLTEFFPDADIEIDISNDGYEIEIEGSIAVSRTAPATGAPYFVKVAEGPLPESILVTLEPSQTFASFKAELSDINVMLSPDEFQGAEFKVDGAGEKILVFGAYVEGRPTTVAAHELGSQDVRLEVSDGIWKKTAAGFLLFP
jgi:hypothetical protein